MHTKLAATVLLAAALGCGEASAPDEERGVMVVYPEGPIVLEPEAGVILYERLGDRMLQPDPHRHTCRSSDGTIARPVVAPVCWFAAEAPGMATITLRAPESEGSAVVRVTETAFFLRPLYNHHLVQFVATSSGSLYGTGSFNTGGWGLVEIEPVTGAVEAELFHAHDGNGNGFALALHPAGHTLYAHGSGLLRAYGVPGNQPLWSTAVPGTASSLVVSTIAPVALVSAQHSGSTALYLVDLELRVVLDSVRSTEEFGLFTGLTLAPDGQRVYAVRRTPPTIEVVSIALPSLEVTSVAGGIRGDAGSVAVAPDGQRIYVATPLYVYSCPSAGGSCLSRPIAGPILVDGSRIVATPAGHVYAVTATGGLTRFDTTTLDAIGTWFPAHGSVRQMELLRVGYPVTLPELH